MYQIWIDTGGTFTDGLALDPDGHLHRVKVLSSSRLRGQLQDGKLVAPWLNAPIFGGYHGRLIETGDEFIVESLAVDGQLKIAGKFVEDSGGSVQMVELFTNEEAPVLATRLLTQTPLNRPFPSLEMRLGTTKGTNALLERKGGRVALLVTSGFKDLLKIGTQQRPDLFQLAIPPADVLYESVWEVDERVAAGGQVITSLSENYINQLIAQLRASQPDAVAVSLLNAYRNPIHEQQLRTALQRAGFPYITLSSEVSVAPQYVPRTQTAVVNAYLTPVMQSYLDNVQRQLSIDAVTQPTVRVMTSAGGLVRADLFQPKDSLLSGPAGGVIGAAVFSEQRPVLTLDMGGTSTDVARIHHDLDYRYATRIGPFDLQLPSLAIETVAAGGGSICLFDGSQLRVGPQSAGANPGPACYGAITPGQPLFLTLTDVNLLLGKLHPKQFGIPIVREKAEAALREISQQIERKTGHLPDELTLLRGFERIANETMAGAIRKISVSRGFDPQVYSLLVFGGAGGLHSCAIARLLGMTSVLLPFDGGLLSAYGIGQAAIERVASLSVLRLLTTVEWELPALIDQLVSSATKQLHQDVGNNISIQTKAVTIYMRLLGQEATIDVPYRPTLETDFGAKYKRLYGHFPADRPVEIESIRVIVSTLRDERPISDAPVSHRHAVAAFQAGAYPAYDWTQLQEGDTLRGPALLLNTTSSAFIEPGWRLIIQADKTAHVDYIADGEDEPVGQESHSVASNEVASNEVVQLELFTQRFRAIAEEMGAQLQRTAFSVNVKERLDFSCALLDANAELVANAPHIPVHLGSLGVCARLVLAQTPLGPGDVLITNHPKYGGSHLPDVTLLSGVFTETNVLIGYVINRAHHAEIGGKVPGSMPPDAVSLVEEGVVLEPTYIVRNNQFLWDTELAARFTSAPYPTRALAENRADIEAALASLRAGEKALQSLVRSYSLPTVQYYMRQLQQSATDAITTVVEPLAGQVYTAEESLDDGHQIHVAIRIIPPKLAVADVSKPRIQFDFTGTSGVHPHNLNANLSILYSAVLYVLRLWCGRDIPLNEGLMAPVAFVLPESSFLNPIFPDDPAACPAVVGGNTEVSQRLVDTLLKALGLAACSQGTMNNFLFGRSALIGESTDQWVKPSAAFGYYETIGGGAGATPGSDGRAAVHQHMTNTKLTDPEELERRYPVRLHQFSIRTGSGGTGRWRGGDGIIREIEFLAPVQATLLSQHRLVAPYGLYGGASGAMGQQTLITTDGQEEALPGIFTRLMQPGERIRIETPGGGGVGE